MDSPGNPAIRSAARLPRAPGVYRFRDRTGQVLYIGRAVTLARGDADVSGWADGMLVCFEIRGGRMSGWRQRPCSAAAARRYLALTPAQDPRWAEFARRNAELAARLRSPRPGLAAPARA